MVINKLEDIRIYYSENEKSRFNCYLFNNPGITDTGDNFSYKKEFLRTKT